MLFPQMKLRSNSTMSDLSLGLYETPILVWPFPASQLHCSSIPDTASVSSPGLHCGSSQPDLRSNSGIPEPYPVLVETPNLVRPLLDPDQSPSSIPVVTSISGSGLLLLCSASLLALSVTLGLCPCPTLDLSPASPTFLQLYSSNPALTHNLWSQTLLAHLPSVKSTSDPYLSHSGLVHLYPVFLHLIHYPCNIQFPVFASVLDPCFIFHPLEISFIVLVRLLFPPCPASSCLLVTIYTQPCFCLIYKLLYSVQQSLVRISNEILLSLYYPLCSLIDLVLQSTLVLSCCAPWVC